MPTSTSPELIATLRLDLSRATLALLEGDARLAELAQHPGETFPAPASEDGIERIGTATVALARVASKRAPTGSVPDRLHPVVRAMAREADAMIESAAAGRPVDLAAMNRYISEILDRTQSGSWHYGTKAARRAIDLGHAYAAIAEGAVALSGVHHPTYGRQVA
jgi:hypothetical protein